MIDSFLNHLNGLFSQLFHIIHPLWITVPRIIVLLQINLTIPCFLPNFFVPGPSEEILGPFLETVPPCFPLCWAGCAARSLLSNAKIVCVQLRLPPGGGAAPLQSGFSGLVPSLAHRCYLLSQDRIVGKPVSVHLWCRGLSHMGQGDRKQ